jgi:2',3'-cyclic-nucleotide 2'-phosphodiesterase (5'-nucleotidase family)
VPYIQKGLDALKGKVDIIVLLIHEGTPARQSSYGNKDVARMLQADIDTAKKFKGIDVLITGHAHVGTPEPIKVNDTLVVSTDAYGSDIGKLVLDFNPQTKKIDGYSGKLITVFADEYKPDPNVQARIGEWNAKLKNITEQVIGSTTAPFTRSYGESSPVGNLVIDAMMAKAPDAVVGLQNSGGLRADFPQGNLRYGDVITTFPFNNELVEMDLTGKDLTDLMIHATNLTNGILQVSTSVHVEYDSKKPLGERIVKFTINNQPVDPTKTYRVATHSFCATGGDGFEAFLKGTNVKTINSTTSAESIIDYVKAHSPLKPDFEKRVVDISAAK